MMVTKNAADLCVLLITEFYGELPSRLFATLLSKGRSSLVQLAHNTAMNPRQIRHGLIVLTQQNLVFYYADRDKPVTHYEANPDAAYNLLRTGKILEMVADEYGEESRSIVQNVLLLGHTKVSDLTEAYKSQANGIDRKHSHPNGHNTKRTAEEAGLTESEGRLQELLARLVAGGILEEVNHWMFQSPQDRMNDIEQDITKTSYPNGPRGARQKADFARAVLERWRQTQDESKALKRELGHIFSFNAKRRKLTNGEATDGQHGLVRDTILDPDVVLRLNYDKCLVELRNEKLSRYAGDLIGDTTAKVYATVLGLLSRKINRCQRDHNVDNYENENDLDPMTGPIVTTMEIFDNLDGEVDVFVGIGSARNKQINHRSADKIQRYPPLEKTVGGEEVEGEPVHFAENDEEDDDDDEEDDDDDDDDDDNDVDEGDDGNCQPATNGPVTNGNRTHHTTSVLGAEQNGSYENKVNFKDAAANKEVRVNHLRQHLMLLAESRQRFLRHCGARDRGEWTVDFELLIHTLKLMELDTLVEEQFGRQGLRLTRILREKGKLDDKTLPNLALMKKSDVHVKMVEMEMAGFLDVQEVPRDTNRTAARTLFLWFFDEERTLARTLDNTYKAMLRCLQRLEVERHKKRNVLSVVERKDVMGMEEEKLRGDYYNEYRCFLEAESKLVGQASRLDDLVAVFRDY